MYASNENNASPDQKKKTSGLHRPYRPLADINGRAIAGSSLNEEALPKIYEESEDEKENISRCESTPRRHVTVGENEDDFISSTPLSRRQHVTPKTSKPWVPYNPFEQDLLPKLHLPVCSPSVFSIVLSPTSNLKEDFDWPIEDISRIKPAAIDEDLDSLQILMHSTQHDAETESKVQHAIDTFFNEKSKIVPSPWSSESDRVSLMLKDKPYTPNHVSTQTSLSLPPVLPPDLEAALKPYFNQDENDCSASSDGSSWELQDFHNQEEEVIVLNQSGLRRKLLFHMSEGACFPSPAATSPLTDGCWKQGFSRSNIQISRELRSPTLSPIGRTPESAKMKEGVLSSSHMSMDVSFLSTPTSSSFCQKRRSLIISENTCTSWTSQQHLYMQQDQNMDSCHSTPVKGESHVSSDQGYHTQSELMDSHNK